MVDSRWNERFRTEVARKEAVISIEDGNDDAKADSEISKKWLEWRLPRNIVARDPVSTQTVEETEVCDAY